MNATQIGERTGVPYMRMHASKLLVKRLAKRIVPALALLFPWSVWVFAQEFDTAMKRLADDYETGPAKGSFSGAGLIGGLVFAVIGLLAINHGRKANQPKAIGIGLLLMLLPFVLRVTGLLYIVGFLLCVLLLLWRD